MESRDAMHDDAATKHHRALPSQYIANPRDTAEQRAKWQGIGHLKQKNCQPTTQTGTGRIPSAVALVICRPAGRARCAKKETHSGAHFLHSRDWHIGSKPAIRLDHRSHELHDIPRLDNHRLAFLKGVSIGSLRKESLGKAHVRSVYPIGRVESTPHMSQRTCNVNLTCPIGSATHRKT